MSRIAFLGLGRMGIGMAQCLLARGHTLCVYNRTAARAEPLVRMGAVAAETPQVACSGAEAIVAMSADDESSRALWCGPDGALSATPVPGALAIECSTLSHDWVLELADRAASQSLRYLDCPVTGLPSAAAAGELTLLIGASSESLALATPLLEAISTRRFHFGPVGAGTAYKLMINLMGAVQIASAAEGMVIAERAGLDPQVVAEAIESSQAASPQVVRNVHRFVRDDHDRDVVFTPVLRLKDVDYALRLAAKLGVNVPFGDDARAAFERLVELGGATSNESRVIEAARERPPRS